MVIPEDSSKMFLNVRPGFIPLWCMSTNEDISHEEGPGVKRIR